MERRFFSGNTLEQAVLAAARFYKLEPLNVAYGRRDKKHGFVNTRRRFVIEVDPLAPEKSTEQVEAAQQELAYQAEKARQERQATVARQSRRPRGGGRGGPRRDGGSRSGGFRGSERRHEHGYERRHSSDDRRRSSDDRRRPSDDRPPEAPLEDLVPFEGIEELAPEAAVRQALEDLVQLADLDVDVAVEQTDEGYHGELSGPDSDRLTEEDGELLLALEHLLSRVARGYCGTGLLCSVDSEGFRAGHEEGLRELASQAAEEVRDSRLAKELETMSPADRRIVHITLADDPSVVTESHGDGFFKSVTVYPA